MDIRDILESYRNGSISLSEAEKLLRMDYLDSVGDDVLFDRARELRSNIPEVVYCMSKSPETVARIAGSHRDGTMVFSKLWDDQMDALESARPDVHLDRASRLAYLGDLPEERYCRVGVITAGTSDIPVAREAEVMIRAMGCGVVSRYDVGVAVLHRILEPMKAMLDADVSAIVVAAGMEGALPTVVSSLSPVPVIGVPVGSGYGHGGMGEAALMCMLQTCALGLTVVNIDNGIGAGASAALVARRAVHE